MSLFRIQFIFILLFVSSKVYCQENDKLLERKTKFDFIKVQIFSGIGHNKIHSWNTNIPTQFKRDLTNFGLGVIYEISGKHRLVLNYNYIYKGVLVESSRQDYIFKYSVFSPNYQIKLFKSLRVNLGPYLGYLHEYQLNGNIFTQAKQLDFGFNLGLEWESLSFKNFSFFLSPTFEFGLYRFSNSKQLSTQIRYGIKYDLNQVN